MGTDTKIIDFHTHIFPDKIAPGTIDKLERGGGVTAFNTGMEHSLVQEMEDSGVSLCVIQPVVTRPEQFSTINMFAAKLNERYAGSSPALLSFGGIHPKTLQYRQEIRAIRDMGLKGIKLHPDYQGLYIDDERYIRLMDYAMELGLIVLIHAGIDVGYPELVRACPKRIRRVIDTLHPDKLVLAHYGGYGQYDQVEEFLVGENVYFDTAMAFESGISETQFLRILDRHGADKILFGTDSPWSSQKENLARLKNIIGDETVLDRILGGNAMELLGLV